MLSDTSIAPPVIGVTTRRGDPEWVQKNTRNYLDVLAEYGAATVILAPDAPATLPTGTIFHPDEQGRLPVGILDHLHGIIFSGGGDVDPKYFGQILNGAEVENIDHKRDELELHLGRHALTLDVPIFGICRGCQVLNVAAGGGMVQHLDNHRSSQAGTAFHPVLLTPGSRLHQIVGQDWLPVNTFHHQGLDQLSLAPIFTPVGVAQPDPWLVEAYESATHRWVVGVQWHPERVFELDAAHRSLWEDFLKACVAYRATAKQVDKETDS